MKLSDIILENRYNEGGYEEGDIKLMGDLILPIDKEIVLQAEEDKYNRGLLVTNNKDKSYDIAYWADTFEPYPIEVEIDGKSVAKEAKVIKLLFHPEMDEGKYKSDAQRKAIYATKAEKEGVNEVDEERFVRAAFEDLEQVIRNLAHTAEISEDEALEMAIRKLEAMLDGRDDMDEGVAKTKKALDLVVNKMKELAKLYKGGDKSVVAKLKDLTAKKKSLEVMLDKGVAGTGTDQELTTEKK